MKTTSKIAPPPKKFVWPPPLKKIYLKFFWWLLTMTATPQLMLNRKWYQSFKPEMEFHMINIMYVALPMCAQTEKTTFSCKDECILTKHTQRWTYSPLRLQYDLCRTSWLLTDSPVRSLEGPLPLKTQANMHFWMELDFGVGPTFDIFKTSD